MNNFTIFFLGLGVLLIVLGSLFKFLNREAPGFFAGSMVSIFIALLTAAPRPLPPPLEICKKVSGADAAKMKECMEALK